MNEENTNGLIFPARPSLGRNVLWIASIALIYSVAAQLSLLLEFQPEGIAAIWPPTGIFLSAVLLTRRGLRPWLVGILLLTDFVAEVLAGTPFLVSAIYSLSLAGDAVLSAWLLIRFVGEPLTFRRVRDLVGWLALSVLFSNALTSLVAAGASELLPGTHSFWSSWQWWATPDGVGNLLVTPFILSWAAWARTRLRTWNRRRAFEWAALFISMALLNFALFQYLSGHRLFALFLPYAILPFLLWAALRFGIRGVATASVVVAAIAVPFAAAGRIPSFSLVPGVLDDVIVLQLFLAVTAIPALFLAVTITERQQARDAVREGEERFRVLFEQAIDGMLLADVETKRFTLANRQIQRLLGYSEDELLRLTVADLHPAADLPAVLEQFERQSRGEIVTAREIPVRRKDGTVFYADINSTAVRLEQRDCLIGVFRDVTERRQTQAALQEGEQRYRAMMEQAADAVFMHDETGRILDANRKACQSLGYSREELLSRTIGDIDPEAIQSGKHELWKRILAGESFTFESYQLRKDGSALPVEVTLGSVKLPAGPAVLGLVRDITQRRQAEEKLRQTNRALRMVSDCNQELVRATNETDLLQGICRIAVEHGGYRMAWVGFAEQDEARSVRPVARSGFDEGYLDAAKITWADDEHGRGPTGTAIRTGQPVATRDIRIDPTFGPWREAAIKRGYASSIALPLQEEGRCFGALMMYAGQPDAFDPEEAKLLAELAGDLSYGIGALRHRGERAQAEAEAERAARDWQATFDATNDAIWILDRDHRVLRTNKIAERFFHRPCAEMLGQRCWAIVHGTAEPHPSCPFVRARQSGHRETMELQVGGRWLEVTVDPILDATGQYSGAVHIVSDITERKRAEEALRNSEAQLRAILDATPFPIALVDADDNKIDFWSRSALTLFGHTAPTASEWYQIAYPDSDYRRGVINRWKPCLEEARLSGQAVNTGEYRVACRDGSVRICELFAAFIADRLIVTFNDITERKQGEAALRESEARFRRLSDATFEAVVIHKGGVLLSANDQYFEMFGYTPDELLGKQALPLTVAPEAIGYLTKQVESGGLGPYESIGVRKDGTSFPIEIRVREAEHEGQRIRVGAIRDISERKQAEKRFREQAALLDAANDAIYVRALDQTVTYWNSGAERLYGWSRAEALGRKITDLGDLDHAAFAVAHAALLEQGYWSGELKKTSKEGKERLVFCRWTLLRDEQGRPKDVLAINTDITEKKQLETQFLRAQRMEAIGALAGGIAHDLNNILTPILMTVPLLRETVSDSESREMLDTTLACAKRGADIIRQLLTFARGQPGVRVPLPMRHLLREMSEIIRETFPRNINLAVTVCEGLWSVLGDATQIHQALMNLCVNARDAMPDGGTLTLAAENLTLDEAFAALTPDARPGAYVCVSVTDTGTGIPREQLERVFDPFFTTKEIGKGTGLGLPTVLGIVRGHGGFVRVESRVGQGTRFEFSLPASPEAKAISAPAWEAPLPRGRGELVLVVDDEAAVRDVVQRTLEKHDYRVLAAADGSEALALFGEHHAEVKAVIADMMMPGMDGPALVRALRKGEPRLPILGMTGLAEQGGFKGLKDLDVSELLGKPFPMGTLLVALHHALTAAAPESG